MRRSPRGADTRGRDGHDAGQPIIRRAVSDEIAVCARLYVEIGRQHFTWQPDSHFQADEFLRSASEEEVWIACRGRWIDAFLSYYAPEHFLHFLFVDRDRRGHGIGSALVGHVRQHYRTPHTLKVQVPNEAARRFYAALGYAEAGRGVSGGVGWLLMRSP